MRNPWREVFSTIHRRGEDTTLGTKGFILYAKGSAGANLLTALSDPKTAAVLFFSKNSENLKKLPNIFLDDR